MFSHAAKRSFVDYRQQIGRIQFSTSVKDWLTTTKGLDATTADSVIKAFPNGKASLSDVQGLGDVGLKELVKAISRQQAQSQKKQETINVHISVPHDRVSFTVKAPVGGTFQTLAQEDEEVRQYLECVCGGLAACSTCHVVVSHEFADLLPPPAEEELDMLDLAAERADTSRLGCQIHFTRDLEGLRVTLPSTFHNVFGSSPGNSM